MNELQKLLLKLKAKRDEVKGLFDKYPDLATMTAEDMTAVKAANAEIETMEADVKRLTDLEEMRSKNSEGIASFKHHTTDAPKTTAALMLCKSAPLKLTASKLCRALLR